MTSAIGIMTPRLVHVVGTTNEVRVLFIEHCIGKLLHSATWVLITAIGCMDENDILSALDSLVALGIK